MKLNGTIVQSGVVFKGILFSAMAAAPLSAQDTARDAESTAPRVKQSMRDAAVAFLDSLSPELRERATFDMDHDERKTWSNLPHFISPREGARFGDMSDEQRILGHKLIAAGLSSQGYLKAAGIMRLDDILRELASQGAGGRELAFGQDFYFIGVFGDPAKSDVWGWQLDGHHLALNFTVVGDRVSVTPVFMGADPAEVRSGLYSGWRILGKEDDRGRALFDSLDDSQRAEAILSAEAPRDVITGPGRGDLLKEPEGIPASELTEEQRRMLLEVISEYAHNLEHDLAHEQMQRLEEAGIENVHFAWAGTEPGKPYYYRIHGPTLLIEFDNAYPPGRSAGPINHIHSVWRDPANEYGEDHLRRHYETSPHHRDEGR